MPTATSGPTGRRHLTEENVRNTSHSPLPELNTYSAAEAAQTAAAWPAVDRYRRLIERSPRSESEKLRLARHHQWLKCALALYHNRANDAEVCRHWSDAADRHIRTAAATADLLKHPVAIFALGKLGAGELNLSSDVDLILITADGSEPPAREAREFIRQLGEVGEFGFCHRVDLDLRPGGKSASLVPSYTQYENHFGYHGEAWERLAGVRLRPIVGDAGVTGQVSTFAKSFTYRRHLDYSMIEELRLLLHRIRSENPRADASWFDLKIHPGGIRDIELFVHALQVIHGGRQPELQQRGTSAAIQALQKHGLMNAAEAKTLDETYWYYRGLENRLQAAGDEQTYRLEDAADLAAVLEHAARIVALSKAAFPAPAPSAALQREDLIQRGYSPEVLAQNFDELVSTHVRSRRSERDEREKNQFLTSFLTALENSGGDRDLGLALLVDFIKGTRAKATLFSMLNRKPELIEQLATLFGVSPWAGGIISSRPELLDAFILHQQSEAPGKLDPEAALDALAERRLLGELVATLHFLKSKDLEACVTNLTALADSIATDLMLLTAQELELPPLGLVALGKWGGCELGIRSDLDFVFTTEQAPREDQFRLAKRFIRRISENPHRGGSIYTVDLRLRPSGNAGPILVSHEGLKAYMQQQAAAWERQSWLRYRTLPQLPRSVPDSLFATIIERGLSESDEAELGAIASRLFKPLPAAEAVAERRSSSAIDIKLSHGGLAPIEFAAQIAILRLGRKNALTERIQLETSTQGMIHFLEGCDSNWKQHGPHLRKTHSWLRGLEQWQRITGDTSGSKLRLGEDEPSLIEGLTESAKRLSELLEANCRKS